MNRSGEVGRILNGQSYVAARLRLALGVTTRMTNDPILHSVPSGWSLTEYRIEFGGAATNVIVVFASEFERIKFRFRNPDGLEKTFAITDDATGIRVLDASSAQREHHRVRVEFLTGEGQRSEFWAESVEYDHDT